MEAAHQETRVVHGLASSALADTRASAEQAAIAAKEQGARADAAEARANELQVLGMALEATHGEVVAKSQETKSELQLLQMRYDKLVSDNMLLHKEKNDHLATMSEMQEHNLAMRKMCEDTQSDAQRRIDNMQFDLLESLTGKDDQQQEVRTCMLRNQQLEQEATQMRLAIRQLEEQSVSARKLGAQVAELHEEREASLRKCKVLEEQLLSMAPSDVATHPPGGDPGEGWIKLTEHEERMRALRATFQKTSQQDKEGLLAKLHDKLTEQKKKFDDKLTGMEAEKKKLETENAQMKVLVADLRRQNEELMRQVSLWEEWGEEEEY